MGDSRSDGGKSYKRSPSVHSQLRQDLDFAEMSSMASNADIGRACGATKRSRRVPPNSGRTGYRTDASSESPPPPPPFAWASRQSLTSGGGWGAATPLPRRACVAVVAMAVAVEALTAAAGSASSAYGQTCGAARRSHGSPSCAPLVLRALGCGVLGGGACYTVLLLLGTDWLQQAVRRRPVLGGPSASIAVGIGATLRLAGEAWVLHDVWQLPVLPKLTGPYCNMQRVVVPRGAGDWGDLSPGTLAISCLWQRGFGYFRLKEVGSAIANSLCAAGLFMAILSRGEMPALRPVAVLLLTAVSFGAVFEGYLLPSETASRMSVAPPPPQPGSPGQPLRALGEQLEWKVRLCSSGALVEAVAAAALAYLVMQGVGPESRPMKPFLGVAVVALLGAVCRLFGEAAQLVPLKLWTQHTTLPHATVTEIVCRVVAVLVFGVCSVALAVISQRPSEAAARRRQHRGSAGPSQWVPGQPAVPLAPPPGDHRGSLAVNRGGSNASLVNEGCDAT